jgi:hypothetical protein
MANHDGRAFAFMLDHGSNVRGKIAQRQICHRASALANAARLRPQNAESFASKQLSDDSIIFCAPPKGRQDHNDWPSSLRNHFDLYIAPIHDEMLF